MLIMEINKYNSPKEIKNRQSNDSIHIINRNIYSSKVKQSIRKHKITFGDTPKNKLHHSFSSANNNKNDKFFSTNLSFYKKNSHLSKKIEDKKTEIKLAKILKESQKSKIPFNHKNSKLISLSIKPKIFALPSRNKNERIDRNGIVINKTNKNKIHITFIDKVQKCKVAEYIQVESYKQYNIMDDMDKHGSLFGTNRCCCIF